MSGGTSYTSTRKGATYPRSFTGRSVALVAPMSKARGKARIYVDGVYVTTVDLYRSSARFRVLVFTRTWTTSRAHTLKVIVAGTKNRPRFDVDAFVIVP